MVNDESQKYQTINKAVVMYGPTGDVNTDSNAYEVPVGLCLARYFVICPQRYGVKDKSHMEYPGNESSLKGEKLMDKPPKLKIHRRPTMTHEYIRHSAVFLQMCNIQDAAEIVKHFEILVTCFSARLSRSAGI